MSNLVWALLWIVTISFEIISDWHQNLNRNEIDILEKKLHQVSQIGSKIEREIKIDTRQNISTPKTD